MKKILAIALLELWVIIVLMGIYTSNTQTTVDEETPSYTATEFAEVIPTERIEEVTN